MAQSIIQILVLISVHACKCGFGVILPVQEMVSTYFLHWQS